MLHKKQRLAVLLVGGLAAGSAQAVDNATRIFFDNSVYSSEASGDDGNPTTKLLATTRTDLLAFEWQAKVYSTGVNDARLASEANPASFFDTKFRMLPMTDAPTAPASFYMGALPRDEPAPPNEFDPITASGITELVKDGARGLDFTTGIFNLQDANNPGDPVVGKFPFGGTINADAVGDGEPDLIFAKLGSDTVATDMTLVDDAGNQLGVAVNINPDGDAGKWLGNLQLDLYDFNDPGTLIDLTRPVTLFAAELSEFGLTSAELADAAALEVEFNGGLDFTFLAANEASIPTASGIETIDSPTGCTDLGGGDFLLTPAPKVQVVNADGDKVEQAGIVVKAEDANTSDSVNFSGTTEETTDANGIATFDNLIVDDCSDPNLLSTTFVITSPGFDPSQLQANNDEASVLEDSGTSSLAIVDNDDFGPNGPGATAIVVTSAPGNGTATVINGGTPNDPRDDQVDYTPDAEFFGTDSFDYEIEDSTGATSTATVTITVEPVNDQPSFMASNPPAVNEDAGTQTVPAWATFDPGAANETGQSVQAYTVTGVSNPGLFAAGPGVANNGDLSYTPADDANGTSMFDVTVTDDGGKANGGDDTSATQTFEITVNAVDDPPIAVDDAATVSEDASPTAIDVLANDTDIDGGPKSVDSVTQPAGGSVTITNGGADVTYQPNADFCNDGSPTDDFTYTLAPGASTATVAMTVTCINDPPIANAASATTDEDIAVTIALSGSDVDGDALDFAIATGPGNGNLGTVLSTGSTTAEVTYMSAADFNGSDSFTYRANDGTVDSALATVDITVDAVNDQPSFTASNPPAVDEDAGAQSLAGWASGFDPGGGSDEASQSVQVYLVSNVSDATLFAVGPSVDTTGVLTYTPADDANGTATFDVAVQDDGGTTNGGNDTSDLQAFTITINAVNDQPSFTASNPPAVDEDAGAQSLAGWASGFDPGGGSDEASQSVQAYLVSNVSDATLFAAGPSVDTNGDLTYTPADDANGTATFDVAVQDDGGTANGGSDTSAVETFTITVEPVNDPPDAVDDSAGTDQDTPVTIDVLANDSDIDGTLDPASVTVVSGPSDGGTMVDAATGNITYTPNAGFAGTDGFDYEVCDDGTPLPVACAQASVTVVIGGQPSAADDSAQVVEGLAVTIDVLANDDFGGDGPGTDAVAIDTPPQNGTATVDDGGTPNDPTDDRIDYTPDSGFVGNDSLIYTITDADGDTATATLAITVEASNTGAPAAGDDVLTVAADNTATADVLANDTFGSDGPGTGAIAIVTAPSDGMASVDDGGTPGDPTDDRIDYTPDAGFAGSDSLVYRIADADGDTAEATVSVTVNDTASGSPAAGDDVADVDEDDSVTIAVLANDDFGGDGAGTTAVEIIDGADNGTATVDDGGTPGNPTDDTVVYTPDADFFGADAFDYRITDADGDTARGTVQVTVSAVNDAPSFTAGSDPTVDEDAGAQTVAGWATAISPGPTNESSQTVSFNVSNDNNALFAAQPTVSPSGDLSYTPAADANGSATVNITLSDDGGTANGGEDTSVVQTFTITVVPVNDAPSFAASNPPTVSEDSGPQSITGWAVFDPGAANETGQSVQSYSVGAVSNPGLFATEPAVAADGTLTYAPAADANGSSTFEVTVTDNGGTANGGVDTSLPQTFTITVGAVNDAPSALDDSAKVDEDGSVSIAVLANDSFGGDGPGTQAIVVTGTPADGVAAVDDGGTPADPTDDVIDYTPDTDFNGGDSFTYRIEDANGDQATASVSVSVAPVNDRPAFTIGANQAAESGAGEQVVSGFATDFDPGPNEADQAIAEFIVSNDNNALFDVQPSIDTGGTLTYTPNTAGVEGTATGTVRVRDDGGTVNGGEDTSEPQTFAIAIGVTADLSIGMSASLVNPRLGEIFDFVIEVANAGPSRAEDLVVTDTLPESLSLIETSGCAEDPSGLPACTLGTLEPGQTRQVTVTVRVDQSVPRVTNTATVDSAASDPVMSNNTATLAIGVALAVPVLGPLSLLCLILVLVGLAFAAIRARGSATAVD